MPVPGRVPCRVKAFRCRGIHVRIIDVERFVQRTEIQLEAGIVNALVLNLIVLVGIQRLDLQTIGKLEVEQRLGAGQVLLVVDIELLFPQISHAVMQ